MEGYQAFMTHKSGGMILWVLLQDLHKGPAREETCRMGDNNIENCSRLWAEDVAGNIVRGSWRNTFGGK